MAVIARVVIVGADQHDHDRLSAAIEDHLEQLGGPPEGLMLHVGYPQGSDLVLVEAWRTEALFQVFADDVLLPTIDAVGLRAEGPVLSPAWSIARP